MSDESRRKVDLCIRVGFGADGTGEYVSYIYSDGIGKRFNIETGIRNSTCETLALKAMKQAIHRLTEPCDIEIHSQFMNLEQMLSECDSYIKTEVEILRRKGKHEIEFNNSGDLSLADKIDEQYARLGLSSNRRTTTSDYEKLSQKYKSKGLVAARKDLGSDYIDIENDKKA